MWVFWASVPGTALAALYAIVAGRRDGLLAPYLVTFGVTYALYSASYIGLIAGLWPNPSEWSADLRYVGLLQPWVFIALMRADFQRPPPADVVHSAELAALRDALRQAREQLDDAA